MPPKRSVLHRSASQPAAPRRVPVTPNVDCTGLHGKEAAAEWTDPRCVSVSEENARPGYSTVKAHEFVDSPAVMKEKVKRLAAMLAASGAACLYTGAGISTASGIRDYASKGGGSVALAHVDRRGAAGSRLELKPTRTHYALAALEQRGLVKHWVNQNHDGLAQKAGFPHGKLNEIHGSWFDPKHNPVVLMDGQLRKDLLEWLMHWCRTADLVVAMGTSLTTRMSADSLPITAAQKHDAGQGLGLVIINLQRTAMDAEATLRINGRTDTVMELLMNELKLKPQVVEHNPWEPVKVACERRRQLRAAIEGKGPWP